MWTFSDGFHFLPSQLSPQSGRKRAHHTNLHLGKLFLWKWKEVHRLSLSGIDVKQKRTEVEITTTLPFPSLQAAIKQKSSENLKPSICFPDAQCENKSAANPFRVVRLCMRMRFSPSGTISQCLMGQKMGVYTPREGTKLTPALQWQGHVHIVQLHCLM